MKDSVADQCEITDIDPRFEGFNVVKVPRGKTSYHFMLEMCRINPRWLARCCEVVYKDIPCAAIIPDGSANKLAVKFLSRWNEISTFSTCNLDFDNNGEFAIQANLIAEQNMRQIMRQLAMKHNVRWLVDKGLEGLI